MLFRVFGLPVMSYGLMLVVGFALGIWRAVRVAKKRYGIEPERVYDIALLVLFSGVLGARLVFVLLAHEPWSKFFIVWEGGLSFHGGFAAALLLGWVYVRFAKLSYWNTADMMAPSAAIAYAVTRIGCFLNGCCHGVATDLPWGVRFDDYSPPMHPTQLYGTLASLLIFVVLVRVERLRKAPGTIFASYVVMYGIYRFLVEFLRRGVTAEVWKWGLTQAQAVSILMIAGGAVAVFLLWRKPVKA